MPHAFANSDVPLVSLLQHTEGEGEDKDWPGTAYRQGTWGE